MDRSLYARRRAWGKLRIEEASEAVVLALANSMVQDRIIVGARGSAELRVIRKGVVFGAFQGVVSGDISQGVFTFYEACMVESAVVVSYIDATEVQTVDGAFRDRATAWVKANPNKNETNVLLRSKMVDMAVSIINLLTGKAALVTFTDRARWEASAKQHGILVSDLTVARK